MANRVEVHTTTGKLVLREIFELCTEANKRFPKVYKEYGATHVVSMITTRGANIIYPVLE